MWSAVEISPWAQYQKSRDLPLPLIKNFSNACSSDCSFIWSRLQQNPCELVVTQSWQQQTVSVFKRNTFIQSALVIRTTFVPLCFSERNVLIASGTYECSYSQRNYLVFWKSVPMADVLIARVSYDVLITRVLITRVDCTVDPGGSSHQPSHTATCPRFPAPFALLQLFTYLTNLCFSCHFQILRPRFA